MSFGQYFGQPLKVQLWDDIISKLHIQHLEIHHKTPKGALKFNSGPLTLYIILTPFNRVKDIIYQPWYS